MRLTTLSTAVAFAALVASGLTSDVARAAPEGLPERPLEIELKAADVKNVFRLLADMSGRSVVLDPCVQGNIDLRLKNAPIPVVYDVLATKLHLLYEDDGGAILVRCATDAGSAAKTATRVNLSEQNAPLPDVLARLATSAKLAGVDYRATIKPNVTITLERASVATVMTALAESSGVKIVVARDRLVVTDPPRLPSNEAITE
jgi:type II secretory pathway component GspD/PulD (secretin)